MLFSTQQYPTEYTSKIMQVIIIPKRTEMKMKFALSYTSNRRYQMTPSITLTTPLSLWRNDQEASIGSSAPLLSNSFEGHGLELFLHKAAHGQSIVGINAHPIKIVEAREIESYDNDEVWQDEDRAFEIIALALTVHVRQKEHAQNDSDHIPLREYQGCQPH